jgi:hypothetical protein
MHPEAHAELRRFRKEQGAIGSALPFPHARQEQRPDQPVSRHLAAWWLTEAFRRGKLQKPDGSPVVDLQEGLGHRAKALAPKDGTLQQCDLDTLRPVVEFERPQIPAPGWLLVSK